MSDGIGTPCSADSQSDLQYAFGGVTAPAGAGAPALTPMGAGVFRGQKFSLDFHA